MKELIVNVYSDTGRNSVQEVQFTFRASHPNSQQNFVNDWNGALEQVRQENPNEWTVGDVQEIMKKMGWNFLQLNVTEVFF